MKSKRIWVVFAGCMLMYGALMGILFNCTGVLIAGIREAEGYTSASLSGFYTLRGLMTAIAVLFTAKIMQKFPIRPVIICVGVGAGLAYILMYFYTAPWMWNISGVLIGLVTSLSFLLPSSVIRAWFVKKRGTFLGIFTVLSGALGATLNPVISAFIENHGWRQAALLMGFSAMGVILLSAFMIVRSPADVGELPYGGTEADLRQAAKKHPGKVPLSIRSYVFIFFAVSVGNMAIQANSYIPQYSNSLGYPLMMGATMTSAIMIGNISAKLLFGIVSDFLGVWRSIQIFFGLLCAAFLGLTFFGNSLAIMYLASYLLGFAYTSGIGLSLVCMELFPGEQYEIQYSRVSMIGSLLSSFVPYAIGYVFDATGSFRTIFLSFAAALVFSICLIALRRRLGIGNGAKTTVSV